MSKNVKNVKKTKEYLDKSAKFKRGNPGRPKGSKNEFTDLKKVFLDVFERIEKESRKKDSKINGLFDWATKNPRQQGLFYQMIAKMLPSSLDVKGSIPINVIVSNQFLPEGSGVKENESTDGKP